LGRSPRRARTGGATAARRRTSRHRRRRLVPVLRRRPLRQRADHLRRRRRHRRSRLALIRPGGLSMHQIERDELTEWIRGLVSAEVELERAVVRREGWIARAGDRRWFLRLGRDDDPANPPEGVVAEGRLVRALRAAG